MLLVLVLAFVVVPFAELFVILQVAHVIGGLATIVVLLGVSLLGGWLVKREGVGVWRQAQARVAAGAVPGTELIDALLILVGGALLLTPGFLTDIVGIVLLLPPVRAGLRVATLRRMRRQASIIQMGGYR